MRAKKPSEMSIEELLKKQKTILYIIYFLLAASIILLLIIVFLCQETTLSALMVIPYSLIPIVIVNSNSLKEIKKEITFRDI